MQCPTCNTPLRSESLHGHAVDRCSVCRGLWLECTELGAIVRQTEPASGASARAFRGNVRCPKCDRLLVSFNYAHDSGIVIGRCDSCGGVWLEEGQLELIAGYRSGTPAERRLAVALADELREAGRWRLARNLLRSRLLSGCVAIAYIVVVLMRGGSVESAVRLTLFLLLPVSCIWFPDAMGNLTGVSFGLCRPTVTARTPGDFVAIGGWLLLLCPIMAALIACR
jgi:Zn-finger nucleic acid-binding protein